MKKILLLILSFVSVNAIAQIGSAAPWMDTFENSNRTTEPTFDEIVTAFNDYWIDKDETAKGSGYKVFKRWESLYGNYLNPNGSVMTQKQLWDAWQAINNTKSVKADESDWQNVGPLTHTVTGSWSAGQGRVNAFALDPDNPSIQYVGTPSGGIWKSINNGDDWTPLSDQLPQIGVSGIAINPTNTDIIYIATGDDDSDDSSSIGVMKSTDGGLTWNTTGLDESNTPESMNEIYFDPANNNILWVATSDGVFKTVDAGATWVNKKEGNFDDLKVKPGSSTVLYAATDKRVFKSADAGENWSSISATIFNDAARIVMDVTPANTEVLYLFTSNTAYNNGKVYKSTNSGESFTLKHDGTTNIFESSQAWFDFAFAVSDTNEDEIYTGVLNIWKSVNGGENFTKVNNWNQPATNSYTHADIHNLRFINNTLYCGSDGGFYASNDGGTNFTSYTDGLAIGQFYRIDVADTDASVISGGLQDNGGYARLNNVWQNYYGADGMENVFDPKDPSTVYGFTQNGGGLYYSENGGAKLESSFNAPGKASGNWITPLSFAKDGKLYAGYDKLFELDFCSKTWQPRSEKFSASIDHVETDPNNPEVIYVGVNSVLHKSTDRGETFTIIKSFEDGISSIEINHGDSNKLYISIRGTEGKVYEGTVSGTSITLKDITGSLPNIPKLVMKHQNFHSDNPLYLGTALGVWKYDDTTNDWERFDAKLPNVAIRDLDINERSGILTAGTYGRGIWQTAIDAPSIRLDLATISLATQRNQAVTCGEVPVLLGLKNFGSETVTAASITYEAGGKSNTIDWTGTLAPQAETSVELPVLGLDDGTYILTSTVSLSGDQVIDNNESTTSITINRAGVANFVNDFEEEDNSLYVVSDGPEDSACSSGSTLWERGIPSGSILNAAASGENVYATNLSGLHPNNTKEYLVTRCYDISALDTKEISFKMAFDLEEDWDIVYMQYTVDNGATWEVLGSADDDNWYNSSTKPGDNCQNCPGKQWTGTKTDFESYSYDLIDFASETSMMFRFVFHSDPGVNKEGVVIDDLTIGAQTLSTQDNKIEGLSIYPNPSKGLFNISISQIAPLSYEVYDMLGKVVLKGTKAAAGDKITTVDMRAHSTGLYLLKINTGDKQLTQKLILN